MPMLSGSDTVGSFSVERLEVACPICGTVTIPNEVFLGELPDYLVYYYCCPRCDTPFDTVYELNRVGGIYT